MLNINELERQLGNTKSATCFKIYEGGITIKNNIITYVTKDGIFKMIDHVDYGLFHKVNSKKMGLLNRVYLASDGFAIVKKGWKSLPSFETKKILTTEF